VWSWARNADRGSMDERQWLVTGVWVDEVRLHRDV
jgi:hypothetical protein